MMAKLHHPNIVQFLGFAQFYESGASQLCIVMELFQHRSVRLCPSRVETDSHNVIWPLSRSAQVEDYVGHHSKSSARTINAQTKRRFCAEMAMALSYLHNRKPAFLIHRDVKVRRRRRRARADQPRQATPLFPHPHGRAPTPRLCGCMRFPTSRSRRPFLTFVLSVSRFSTRARAPIHSRRTSC